MINLLPMKISLVILCLVEFAICDNIVILSGIDTTTITNPAGVTLSLNNTLNQENPNYLSNRAQWIWPNTTINHLNATNYTFLSMFNADCPGNAVLTLSATSAFTVFLNNAKVVEGQNMLKMISFNVNLVCGANNLTVIAKNIVKAVKTTSKGKGIPRNLTIAKAGLIFSINQSENQCYNCSNPAAYYNRQTCLCECIESSCSDWRKKTMKGFPTCACVCSNEEEKQQCNSLTHYFDEKRCKCLCKKKYCEEGYSWHKKGCVCVKLASSYKKESKFYKK